MGCKVCKNVVYGMYTFKDGSELGLYFPDENTLMAFQQRLEVNAVKFADGELSRDDYVKDIDYFIDEIGITVEGFEYIPLVLSLKLVEYVVGTREAPKAIEE